MSRIYNIIEGQVNNILRITMEGEDGQVEWDFWSQYIDPKYIRVIVSLIASIIYLMLFSMLGIYLWNQGIHVMAPNVVKAFGNQQFKRQNDSPSYPNIRGVTEMDV